MRRALVAAHQRPEHSLPKPLRPKPKCWEWSLGLYIPSTEAARSGWAATIDTKLGWIRACASLAPRCKSVLVARSLVEPIARVCPKGRIRAAYTLKVCVCRVNRSKLRATSTDSHRGARDAHGRTRHGRPSTLGTQSCALLGAARMSHAQPYLESRWRFR